MITSEHIDKVFKFENKDKSGYISNVKCSNSYYFNKSINFTRSIKVDSNSNIYNQNKTYENNYNAFSGLNQYVIVENRSNTLGLYVNNTYKNAKTLVSSAGFFSKLNSIQGTSLNSSKIEAKNTYNSKFDKNVWMTDPAINDGLPVLKYRYWQNAQ